MLGENCMLMNLWLNISFFSLFFVSCDYSAGGTPENSRWECPGSPNPDPLIKNKTLTAVIDFVSFSNFITWRFVCYFNIHFQKWSSVTVEDNDETILQTDKKCHFPHPFSDQTFRPGGDSAYERGGDARRKFWIKPLKETDLGEAQTFFDP